MELLTCVKQEVRSACIKSLKAQAKEADTKQAKLIDKTTPPKENVLLHI